MRDDLYWKNYYLPTKSDKSIRLYTTWINKHFTNIPFFRKNDSSFMTELSKEQVLDRYDQHVKHCSQCQNAISRSKQITTILSSFMIALVAFTRNPIFFAFIYLIKHVQEKFESMFYFNDYVHNEVD
tara:strand:- start:326 stop:706 length:381 start_codon:yes stop_codon:yes gene_type:complete